MRDEDGEQSRICRVTRWSDDVLCWGAASSRGAQRGTLVLGFLVVFGRRDLLGPLFFNSVEYLLPTRWYSVLRRDSRDEMDSGDDFLFMFYTQLFSS